MVICTFASSLSRNPLSLSHHEIWMPHHSLNGTYIYALQRHGMPQTLNPKPLTHMEFQRLTLKEYTSRPTESRKHKNSKRRQRTSKQKGGLCDNNDDDDDSFPFKKFQSQMRSTKGIDSIITSWRERLTTPPRSPHE